MNLNTSPTPLQKLEAQFLRDKGIECYVKRDDLIHPEISGNKWRKLKFNLLSAREKGLRQLLTFGGAYSNHIYAVAAAGKAYGFETIGIIRGEEHLPLNHTLQFAQSCGMTLKYVDRTTYKHKYEKTFQEALIEEFGASYIIPEGGSNVLAVQGCTEIIPELNIDFDIICCACGTGGTITGLIASASKSQQVIGFPALKGGDFLYKDIEGLLHEFLVHPPKCDFSLQTDYHFGGYAKVKPEQLRFMKDFEAQFNIPLDPIYTSKMFFGLFDMIKNDAFEKGAKIVALHTGGLQGIEGMKQRGLV